MSNKIIELYRQLNLKTNDNEQKSNLNYLLDYYFPNWKLEDKTYSDKQIEEVKSIFNDLLNKKAPIQYLIGEAWFYHNYFYVNPSVLIPRDDSVQLILQANKLIKSKYKDEKIIKVLDLGCGSGCLGISLLLENSNIHLTLCDFSKDALEVSKRNLNRFNLKAECIQSDWFSLIENDYKFHLILSNPPYLTESECKEVQQKYSISEPKTALFADQNGLADYQKILSTITPFLMENGVILFEIGMQQANDVKELAVDNGFKYDNIFVYKDISNKDRVVEINL